MEVPRLPHNADHGSVDAGQVSRRVPWHLVLEALETRSILFCGLIIHQRHPNNLILFFPKSGLFIDVKQLVEIIT